MPAQSVWGFLNHIRLTTPLLVPPADGLDLIVRASQPEGISWVVEEDTYEFFRDFQTPKYLGHGFVFTQGSEPFRYFWAKSGMFFCRQFSWDETMEFCQLARIPPPEPE